ncbi:MAG: TlpA disulfide reductase family protein [Pyrinomonadaceae bacterium]
MRSISFRFFAVFFLFSALGLFAQTPKAEAMAAAGPQTPKVTKVDEVQFKKLLKTNGKPLLINFWATWCVPCREEFPDLVKLDEQYRGKIDFITVSLDDLAEINRDVPQFLKEMNARMPAYLLYTNKENEVIGSIDKNWSGGLPFSVLYDEKSNLVFTKQGKIDPKVISTKIDGLIGQETAEVSLSNPELLRLSYEKGVADAKKDVADGRFIIRSYGLTPGISDESRRELKEKYGIEYADHGCLTSESLKEYIRGYNEISKPAVERILKDRAEKIGKPSADQTAASPESN